ncbi:hypothetical protein WA026_014171 [Henosepilachna vigintioctopunctata]|uniref:Ribosomal protein S4 n=1 Tax=Henosepilachna vigintioctopunctata TaxID=420089 RepID=A0AAW1TTM5_9CUCU
MLQRQPQTPQNHLINKLYYSTPKIVQNNLNENHIKHSKKTVNSGSILQYYYNNFHNFKNSKQTNVYYENVLKRRRNELAFLHGKAPFSSTKRPLSIRLSTPKHITNFLNKFNQFKSDSQKRPLLLQGRNNIQSINENAYYSTNIKVLCDNMSSVPSIHTISEDVDKCSLYEKNLYISSNSRPLFVRK